jgi:hypothetical protein
VILVAVFGGPNKPTEDTSQAPSIAPAVTSNAPPPAASSNDEYYIAISQETKDLGESLVRFRILAKNARPNDDHWRIRMAVEFAIWQVYYEGAQSGCHRLR